MPLIWKRHLSVGNEMLDFDHKKLIGMVNSIECAISTKDRAALLRVFNQFVECSQAHFANESKIAQALKFPFEQHAISHQYLLAELQRTKDELEANSDSWTEYVMDHYPQLLREWLINHITKEDMLLKPILQNYPIDSTLIPKS